MLKGIRDQLKTDIKSGVSDLKLADRYRGELEPENDWTPVFPFCLIEFNGALTLSRASDGTVTNFQCRFFLHVGDDDDVMDVLELVYELLDGHEMTVESTRLVVQIDDTPFKMYMGGKEIFTIVISVSK